MWTHGKCAVTQLRPSALLRGGSLCSSGPSQLRAAGSALSEDATEQVGSLLQEKESGAENCSES